MKIEKWVIDFNISPILSTISSEKSKFQNKSFSVSNYHFFQNNLQVFLVSKKIEQGVLGKLIFCLSLSLFSVLMKNVYDKWRFRFNEGCYKDGNWLTLFSSEHFRNGGWERCTCAAHTLMSFDTRYDAILPCSTNHRGIHRICDPLILNHYRT